MKTNSDTPQKLYIGLDVHKEQTVIAILESDRDAEPRQYGSIATAQHALERAMRRIAKQQKRELADLHVCYEASGCGFWIARRLLQMGVQCDVIAPSLIPTRSGDRVKTDKRDAANIATIDFHEERIAKLENEMLQLLEDWQRKPLVKALMAFKGFKLVAAMVTVSEIGTFSRFEHPKKLMAFLGLVPSENSSGGSRRQGAISKCGNPHARWLLVEQATHYRVPPKVSAQLSERQRHTPRWIRELSWKTQTRLSHRFATLRKRQMHHNKIKVSIARELVGFLWELGTRIEAKQAAS